MLIINQRLAVNRINQLMAKFNKMLMAVLKSHQTNKITKLCQKCKFKMLIWNVNKAQLKEKLV